MVNPFRKWLTARDEAGQWKGDRVPLLRPIGDVTYGRPRVQPTIVPPVLSERCDRCGHEPMVVLRHGCIGDLDLCGHDADVLVGDMESRGWVVVLDRRQSTADRWRNPIAR